MPLVFESKSFNIIVPERPHISRADGGHIIIIPKTEVEDRTKLSPEHAVELMKLTMVAGEAMKTALSSRGIEIGRINYQDNGNWTHLLHIHLYGRAKNAPIQKYGAPLNFPATKEEFLVQPALPPLNEDDISEISKEIKRLLNTDKYKSF
ncbi:MAG: HIT domain-containing protein [Candidatus Niyogibacteria bacterium]|nr:MAG: HIT domain-containing protein [Candidatus Niyogibacteria bacterium]